MTTTFQVSGQPIDIGDYSCGRVYRVEYRNGGGEAPDFEYPVAGGKYNIGPCVYCGAKASFELIGATPLDSTPPLAGAVTDGALADQDFQASSGALSAFWSGFDDPETGVSSYEWAIGTTAGGTDVQPFVAAGTATSATNTALALTHGATYFVTVRGRNLTNLTVDAISDGIRVDMTGPTGGAVSDGSAADLDVQGSTTTLAANWSGFADPESGVVSYAWAIGTTAGGVDVQPFVSVGATTSVANSALTLADATTYFVTVRAYNGAGGFSEQRSDGVLVSTSAPVAGSVFDGTAADVDFQLSTSRIDANWSGFSAASGISGYEWAIGTAPGLSDVQAFTSVGLATTASNPSLSLTNGATYYVTVRATMGSFTVSATSDGVLVDSTGPTATTVRDGAGADIDFQSDGVSLRANWGAFSDPESGIVEVEWAIGTTQAGTEVQPYTPLGTTATSATATGLTLVSGTRYFVIVRARNGVGTLTRAFTDGVLVDLSAPAPGQVLDGAGADADFQSTTSGAGCNWTGFSDAQSPVVSYEWALGTTPGAEDVQLFTPVGLATAASSSSLALDAGTQYFGTVRAWNAAGLWSEAASDGVLVDDTPPGPGQVSDGTGADVDVQTSLTAISANWTGFADPESAIAQYEWAVGTAAGASDVLAFTGVGQATSGSAGGLSLSSGGSYFVTVRATNGAGLSSTASSDGVTLPVLVSALRVFGVPSPVRAGQPSDVTVELLTPDGGLATEFTGQVTFSSSDPLAQLPPPYTVPLGTGRHTFPGGATLMTPGTHSITASAASGTLSASQSGITVLAATAPDIVREANLLAAVGVPYRYSALNAVRASGRTPLSFESCGTPAGFAVDASSGALQWTPAAAGPQGICLTARNADGADSYAFTVQVAAAAPAAPTAAFTVSPGAGQAPLDVVLDGAGSTGSPPLVHLWSSGDGRVPPPGVTSAHRYALPGAYFPTLTVFDAYGAEARARGAVRVSGPDGQVPPACRIEASPAQADGPLEVHFRADCLEGTAPIAGYGWRFDRSRTADTPEVTVELSPGRYHVSLTVADQAGLSSSDELEVVVTLNGRAPPRCRASVDAPVGVPVHQATWDGWASTGDASPAEVSWDFGDGQLVTQPRHLASYAAAGRYLGSLLVLDGSGLPCEDHAEVTVLSASGAAPPRIVSVRLPPGVCGLPLDQGEPARAAAVGAGPLRWSLVSGPAGLTVDESSGAVRWTPPRGAVGASQVTLAVEGPGGRDEVTVEATVECSAARHLWVGFGCQASGAGASPWLAALLLARALNRRSRSP